MHTTAQIATVWLVVSALAAVVWSLTARHFKKGGGRRG